MRTWLYNSWRLPQSASLAARVRVTTPPTSEPISLDDAYRQLRIDDWGNHPDQLLVRDLISASRAYCEGYTGRALAPQTVDLATDGFPGALWNQWPHPFFIDDGIELPLSPVVAIVSIQYVDADAVLQTMDVADYELDLLETPNRLVLADGVSWPATKRVRNAVRIQYLAGYSAAADSPQDLPLPPDFKAAMMLMLGHLYENRAATTTLQIAKVPIGVDALLSRYDLNMNFA